MEAVKNRGGRGIVAMCREPPVLVIVNLLGWQKIINVWIEFEVRVFFILYSKRIFDKKEVP